jgi:hypothetical protein
MWEVGRARKSVSVGRGTGRDILHDHLDFRFHYISFIVCRMNSVENTSIVVWSACIPPSQRRGAPFRG